MRRRRQLENVTEALGDRVVINRGPDEAKILARPSKRTQDAISDDPTRTGDEDRLHDSVAIRRRPSSMVVLGRKWIAWYSASSPGKTLAGSAAVFPAK